MTPTLTSDGTDGTELGNTQPDTESARGPGTGLWVVLVVAALVFGGAIGWRIGKGGDTSSPSATSVDVGFFQDMATHHNQAIAMASDYLEHGTDSLLRQIANEILVYQASEIGVMNDHLTQWGQNGTAGPIAMRWMGMPEPRDQMMGLATKQQMTELGTARGSALGDLFTKLMIRHHEAGVQMAEYAAQKATTSTVKQWAKAMADGQRGEIAELNRWRVQHGLAAVQVHLG
ncbi:MAG: DUF305 domain-containing protein [Acidimicrobiia bacterium]